VNRTALAIAAAALTLSSAGSAAARPLEQDALPTKTPPAVSVPKQVFVHADRIPSAPSASPAASPNVGAKPLPSAPHVDRAAPISIATAAIGAALLVLLAGGASVLVHGRRSHVGVTP
jgi:hypothetical protein